MPARSFGQQIEPNVAIGRGLPGRLGPPGIASARGHRLGVADGVLDRVPLLVDDVVELAGDLVVHAAEVEAVESLLALAAQPVEQLAHAGEALATAVAQALVHHPAQRGVDVAVVQQLVGELLERARRRRARTPAGCHPTASR